MQYCSLQHRTLIPSPVTSTTGCYFCFGSISSSFVELFLHWSPITYWVSTYLWSSSFSIVSFCLFILFMEFSGFSSGHVWMWELDCEEGWAPKNCCFRNVLPEKTLESPLGSKEATPVNLKGNQTWIFTGRTNAEAEAPVFWSSDATADSLEKSLILGKIEGRKRRGRDMRWLESITDSMDMNLGKLWEMVRDREAWHAAAHGITKSWTWLGNWTTIITTISYS